MPRCEKTVTAATAEADSERDIPTIKGTIDSYLAEIGFRSLLSSAEVVDVLLDIRSLSEQGH
jgi:hypothetical protein